MLGGGTIGNKFWIMAQPSPHQGQHRAIVLLRQDDDAFGCLLLAGPSRLPQNILVTLKSILGRGNMSALLFGFIYPLDPLVNLCHSCQHCAMFPGNLKEIPYVADDKFLTLHSGVGGCGPWIQLTKLHTALLVLDTALQNCGAWNSQVKWIPNAMHCKVLNWTHWIAENPKVGQTPAIIHRFLLHQVISCNDCNAYVNQDDDTRNHNRESHMAECDWCVGDCGGETTQGFRPHRSRDPRKVTLITVILIFFEGMTVWKFKSVKVWKFEMFPPPLQPIPFQPTPPSSSSFWKSESLKVLKVSFPIKVALKKVTLITIITILLIETINANKQRIYNPFTSGKLFLQHVSCDSVFMMLKRSHTSRQLETNLEVRWYNWLWHSSIH